jgi:tRNA (guanine37-N1)-methyltransferase
VRFDIVTLFPEMFENFLATSLIARAISNGRLSVRFKNPRAFGLGKHRSVDDTPYGGGSGMVMRVDVLVTTMESMDSDAPDGVRAHRVLLSPRGRVLDQAAVQGLADRPAIMLVCGRYEGFDDRVREYVQEELSLGDFVLAGGEVAAMAVVEACGRLIPGVLGNQASSVDESHSPRSEGLLEYPHYTRPMEFRGARVPEVLQGGNHGDIARWRHERSVERTREIRPDIWERIRRGRSES